MEPLQGWTAGLTVWGGTGGGKGIGLAVARMTFKLFVSHSGDRREGVREAIG